MSLCISKQEKVFYRIPRPWTDSKMPMTNLQACLSFVFVQIATRNDPISKHLSRLKRFEHLFKTFLIVDEILFDSSIGNVKSTVWRKCILMFGHKGLIIVIIIDSFLIECRKAKTKAILTTSRGKENITGNQGDLEVKTRQLLEARGNRV